MTSFLLILPHGPISEVFVLWLERVFLGNLSYQSQNLLWLWMTMFPSLLAKQSHGNFLFISLKEEEKLVPLHFILSAHKTLGTTSLKPDGSISTHFSLIINGTHWKSAQTNICFCRQKSENCRLGHQRHGSCNWTVADAARSISRWAVQLLFMLRFDWRDLTVADFCSSLSWYLLACGIPRYL